MSEMHAPHLCRILHITAVERVRVLSLECVVRRTLFSLFKAMRDTVTQFILHTSWFRFRYLLIQTDIPVPVISSDGRSACIDGNRYLI